jgi:hypothetical protein
MPRRPPPRIKPNPRVAVLIGEVDPEQRAWSYAAKFPDGCDVRVPMWDRQDFIDALLALAEHGAGKLVVARSAYVASPVDRAVAVAGARMFLAELVVLDATDPDSADPAAAKVTLAAEDLVETLIAFSKRMHGLRVRVGREAHPDRPGGEAPYGYRRDENGRMVVNESEAAILARAQALRATGASFRAIADKLLAEGFEPRRGGTWAPQTISNLLARGRVP